MPQTHTPAGTGPHPSPLGRWTILRSDSELLPVFPPQENKFAHLDLEDAEPSGGGKARCKPSYPRGHAPRLPELEVRVLGGRFESDEIEGSEGRTHRLVGVTFQIPGDSGTYLAGALITRPKGGSDAPSSVDPWVARDEGPGRPPGGCTGG